MAVLRKKRKNRNYKIALYINIVNYSTFVLACKGLFATFVRKICEILVKKLSQNKKMKGGKPFKITPCRIFRQGVRNSLWGGVSAPYFGFFFRQLPFTIR